MAGPTATGYLELDLSGFNRAIDSAKKALTVLVGAFAALLPPPRAPRLRSHECGGVLTHALQLLAS